VNVGPFDRGLAPPTTTPGEGLEPPVLVNRHRRRRRSRTGLGAV